MNNRFPKLILFCGLVTAGLALSAQSAASSSGKVHVWEMQEIVLQAAADYDNYYTEVTSWVDLKGPDFSKRVYGFWDGGNKFVIRVVATKAGEWTWRSGSNQPADKGLNGHTGAFKAVAWSKAEKVANPNRRGFLRATSNGHALQYDDGTPFFMIGDTWLAGATWRLPYRGAATAEDYVPGPGIGFEDAVLWRKRQGFNSVSMIASFPNWDTDTHASTYADANGIFVRNAWEKFGYYTDDGQLTAKDMRDEYGNMPFQMSSKHPGVADFTRINPEYFQSLDKKMQFLSEQGFVSLLETVRRDMGPTWGAYFDFNETYANYVQYLISRYGAWNFVFSGIHLDWIPKEYSLTADQFNEALTYHLKKFGPLPFGQPHTTLINDSTYTQFGHDKDCPWLTMHSVGNKPRNHGFYPALETLFKLEPPYPAINFEPYYTGWDHEINMPGGERPPADSARDNYFSRSQMYGSVLSGGLSGHVHGTAAYDITTTGEPAGARPHIWDALRYESGNYMQHLAAFVLSEGGRFQQLQLGSDDIQPRKAPNSAEDGLDGWSFMMRTAEQDFALLYFENQAILPVLKGFKANAKYSLRWFDPRNGDWLNTVKLQANGQGELALPAFPDRSNPADTDWAAKITAR